MLALMFDQTKLPRTMKRTEWQSIYRWKRQTQKQLREFAEREAEVLRAAAVEAATFGTSIIGLDHMVDGLIHPRLLIGPYQDTIRNFDIKPGAVAYA